MSNFYESIMKSLRNKRDAEHITSPYLQNVYAYISISTIAKTISSIPFCLWSKSDKTKSRLNPTKVFNKLCSTEENREKGLSELSRVEQHQLIDLFENPNKTQTEFEFWESIVLYFYSCGSCLIIKIKDGNGGVVGLLPTPGKEWSRTYDEYGHVEKYIRTISVNQKKSKIEYTPDDIIPLEMPHPDGLNHRFDLFMPLDNTLNTDYKARKYNSYYFDNNAEAGVVLETDMPVTPEESKQLLNTWNSKHKGPGKNNKAAILGNGFKAKVLNQNHKDMQFAELAEASRDEVFGAYGVPKILAGLVEDANRATFLGCKRVYFEITIIPLARRIASSLYKHLIRDVDKDLFGFFDLSQVEGLRADNKEKAEIIAIYHRMGIPFKALNERFDAGFESIPFDELGFMPHGFIVSDIVEGGTLPGGGRPSENNTTEQEGLLNDEKSLIIKEYSQILRDRNITLKESNKRHIGYGIALLLAKRGLKVENKTAKDFLDGIGSVQNFDTMEDFLNFCCENLKG